MAATNHIAIFSDRIAAAHATISSVCSTSASVSSLAFYLITANVTAAAALLALFDNHHGGGGGINGLASSCIGASIRVVSDRAAESAIRAARGGRAPSWMWTSYENELRRETTNANDGEPDKDARDFWVKPARWDHSVMHAHRLNHLRFYLPYLFPRDVRKVILLDDDVILLDDIRLVYDAAFPEEDDEDQDITPTFLDDDDDDDGQLKQNHHHHQQQHQHQHSSSYLVSNCKLWKHDVAELHMWQWRTRLNMLQTTHTGLQEMYDPRAVWEVLCSAEERSRSHAPLRRRGCMRSSAFFDDLRTLALEQVPTSVGISQAVAQRLIGDGGPFNTTAWNYGIVLADLRRMRAFGAVELYEAWVRSNLRLHIFPLTSLGFGLGIAYLATQGRVACFSDVSPSMPMILEGLGYVPSHSFPWNFGGASFTDLVNADDEPHRAVLALHYNGPSKPLANTTPPSFDEYNPPYLRHASRSEREDWAALSYDRMVQQRVRTEQQRRRWNTRRQRRRRHRRRDGNGEDYYYQDNNDEESTTIYSSSSSSELNYRRAVIIVAASAATAQPYVYELHNVLNRTVCSWFTLPNADAKSSYGIVRWPADALSPEGSIFSHEDLLSMLNYEKSHTATMPSSSSSSSGVRSAESGRPDWDLAMKSKQLLCTWSILSARLRDLAQLRGTQRSEICDEAEERYYRTSIVDAPLVGVEHVACGILRHDLEEWDTKTNNIDSLMQQAFLSFVQHAVFGVASKTQLDRIPCSCSSSRNLADRDSIVILQLIHPTSLPDLHEALLLMIGENADDRHHRRQDSHSDPAVVIASLPGDEEAIAAMMDEVDKAKDRKSDVMIDFFVGNDNHSKTEWASNVYSLIAI